MVCCKWLQNVSLPTVVIKRAISSNTPSYDWKIFGVGAGKKPVPEAQKKLAALGYKNMKLLGIYNTNESDQEVIAGLKEKQWDVVVIGSFFIQHCWMSLLHWPFFSVVAGGYVNGFDQDAKYHEKGIPTDRAEILLWFNRVLNLVQELAPKAKIVLVKSPQDVHDGIQRIMGAQQKQTKAWTGSTLAVALTPIRFSLNS